jgi:hypothetical protein
LIEVFRVGMADPRSILPGKDEIQEGVVVPEWLEIGVLLSVDPIHGIQIDRFLQRRKRLFAVSLESLGRSDDVENAVIPGAHL